ncbi:MAG: tetratricopeptide repeat protein [Candidatus Wallbacteria bacterium]|nr:tetratricopeptide repeat protein [Candidatus Wallbacteria bacterium]
MSNNSFYLLDNDQVLKELLKQAKSDDKYYLKALYQIAYSILKERLEDDPHPGKTDYVRLGILLREMGEFDESFGYFEKALALGSDSEALYETGNLFKQSGDFVKALDYLEKIPENERDEKILELIEYCRKSKS